MRLYRKDAVCTVSKCRTAGIKLLMVKQTYVFGRVKNGCGHGTCLQRESTSSVIDASILAACAEQLVTVNL